MKKLFSGCCCPIVYYKQFLVVGKKGLTIYKEVEPNVFEEYFHTSKINNVEFLNCCEDKLYAKNSSGKFLIYDFKSNSIFAIFRYKKPLLPVEMNFYLLGEFEFLDITKTEEKTLTDLEGIVASVTEDKYLVGETQGTYTDVFKMLISPKFTIVNKNIEGASDLIDRVVEHFKTLDTDIANSLKIEV